MTFRRRTITELADMICGNFDDSTSFFPYRSSSYLTEFFRDCNLEFVHDGSTRKWWAADVLEKILSTSASHPKLPSDRFIAVVQCLMDRADATNEDTNRAGALEHLNTSLAREGFCAYYDDNGVCRIKNIRTHTTSTATQFFQRAWTNEELETRRLLEKFLASSSEDEITGQILLPLFRQLGFQRITEAGHADKALEYGNDVWMKYRLPTKHELYFGVQVKKGKIHSSGRAMETNIAGLLSQIQMMLGHLIFDPEVNKKRLIDHAIIVSGGEITKQARNWLGGRLDASQRSQILFMERDDILDLWLINGISLPKSLEDTNDAQFSLEDDVPF